MSSLSFYHLLVHCEEHPSLTRPRHPLVVFFHLPYALALVLAYGVFAEKTAGQTLYFAVAIVLYLVSAANHVWKPNRFLRFVDQTMISWYVLVTPLPFVYHESWALLALGTMMTLMAINKWYEWESSLEASSLVFFGLGAISASLVFGFGLPTIGVNFVSYTSFWVVVAIACFIGKLVIYHYGKLRLIPNVWEAPESGHSVLAMGITIYTTIVLLNPV